MGIDACELCDVFGTESVNSGCIGREDQAAVVLRQRQQRCHHGIEDVSIARPQLLDGKIRAPNAAVSTEYVDGFAHHVRNVLPIDTVKKGSEG